MDRSFCWLWSDPEQARFYEGKRARHENASPNVAGEFASQSSVDSLIDFLTAVYLWGNDPAWICGLSSSSQCSAVGFVFGHCCSRPDTCCDRRKRRNRSLGWGSRNAERCNYSRLSKWEQRIDSARTGFGAGSWCNGGISQRNRDQQVADSSTSHDPWNDRCHQRPNPCNDRRTSGRYGRPADE